jgi:hypothetical protein
MPPGIPCKPTDGVSAKGPEAEPGRTFVRGGRGAVDLNIEVPEIVFVGNSANTGDSVVGCVRGWPQGKGMGGLRFGHEPLGLLDDSLR